MGDLDAKFVSLAMDAIRDSEKWQRALEHIMHVTGAKAAMITLRDKKNCQIVNDDILEKEYHSPLICGFSYDGVVFYLQNLRAIDPWAEAQITHYPHRPTIMSEVCNPDTVADQEFFKWLNDQGIEDTITFELEKMPGYWTACNLFLEKRSTQTTQSVLDFANTHLEFFRNAWQASQELIRTHQSSQAALDQLANIGVPACIIINERDVYASNDAFDRLVDAGDILVSKPSGRLSIPRSASLLNGGQLLADKIAWHNETDTELNITASPFHSDPLFKDKKVKFWLLSFETDNAHGKTVQKKFDLEILDRQEERLFKAILSGRKVKDAGKDIGLGHSRTYVVWKSIREKLGIKNAHTLR